MSTIIAAPDEAPVTRAETPEQAEPRRLFLSNGMRLVAFPGSAAVQLATTSLSTCATLFLARADIPAVIAFLSGPEETSEPDAARRLALSNGMRLVAFPASDDDVQVSVVAPLTFVTLFLARQDIPALIAFLSGFSEEGQS